MLVVDVEVLEVAVVVIIGLAPELMLELGLELSVLVQFLDHVPVQLPVQVEFMLVEEFTKTKEVVKDVAEVIIGDAGVVSDVVVDGADGVVSDVGIGELVGVPGGPVQGPVQEPVQEPFQGPVHEPVQVGLDVFMAEMTLTMLEVIF